MAFQGVTYIQNGKGVWVEMEGGNGGVNGASAVLGYTL
jgi:hypothetical protein